MNKQSQDQIQSISRRAFLQRSLASSVAIGTALSGYSLFAGQAFGANFSDEADRRARVKEDKLKQRLAKTVFNFYSPYHTSDHLSTPHAHHEIKTLIEQYTDNKVYVKIHDGGRNGIGSSLSSSVKHGVCQGALLSVANLAPLVKELDVLNIPFWSAGEDELVRLFGSQIWNKKVLSKTHKHNIQVLFPYVVGARTATSLKSYDEVISQPEDFEDVLFRVPGSASLYEFYSMAKASPMKIDWKLCAKAARKQRFEALDCSISGLYSGPDQLHREIGIISEINSVHDAWVAIGNTDYIAALDSHTRGQFLAAFDEIQLRQREQAKRAKSYCSDKFIAAGVEIYTPTVREKSSLEAAFSHSSSRWSPVKKRLLGPDGMAIFDQLYQVAKG